MAWKEHVALEHSNSAILNLSANRGLLNMRPEKLIRASETVLHNPEDIADGRRTLEWRRSFNFISLPVKDLQLVYGCHVHEIDYSYRFEEAANNHPSREIVPCISDFVSISGQLDDDKMRDFLSIAKKNRDNKENYDVIRGKYPCKVQIRSGSPSNEDNGRPSGLYWGNAFHYDSEPGEDQIQFELTVPHEQMLMLASEIKQNRAAKLELGAYLLSYTYEVDDALREPWHSQDIIIENMALCFLSFAKLNLQIDMLEAKESEESEPVASQSEGALDPKSIFMKPLIQALAGQSARTDKLTSATWALVVVIALAAIFK